MASTSYDQTQSSSASTLPPTRWDVFLSFRGIDTRYKFISHLYAALDRHGFQTFKDDPDELSSREVMSEDNKDPDALSSGEVMSEDIKDSKTYVVVFSENYASLSWCLDQLVKILSCCTSMGRLVVPLYYNIEPSVVHHQTGSFGEAFEKYETCFNKDRLAKWRVALATVANLPGHQVCKNVSEADIINEVVNKVLLEINPIPLDVPKYPVGLDSRIKDVTTLMSSKTEGIIRIGIYGMGGVGKTTLAKAVYNQNYQRFQGSCFLANVREVSSTEEGLACLQQQLVNDVLKCKHIIIDYIDQGIEVVRDRLASIKVLIVIDDLDNPMPLEFLEGPFAIGSTIIITTRNEDLLDSVKVEARYKVNELGDAESRQLLTQHAFGNDNIPDTFRELSQEILERAGGLPLALEVFGSNLREERMICIDKVKQLSITNVIDKLLISFDGLKRIDPMLQDIFLDIACFFIGRKKEEVFKIMKTWYTFVNLNIDILKKRCLLTINNRDELEMHDLLRDMGREITRNNSPDEPEKHSRLWELKDIYNVLKQHKGTEAIECIVPYDVHYEDAFEELSFAAETFKGMSNLRFLHIYGDLTGSFEETFEDLRWLCWDRCPLTCLPSEFDPPNLVILELPHSKIRRMFELNTVPGDFEKLCTLNMSNSVDLTETPDFTKLPYLETLNLEGCTSMERLPNLSHLKMLEELDLTNCNGLKEIEGLEELASIRILRLGGCNSSLLANTLTRTFFQVYSEFGHEISVYGGTQNSESHLDWISESPYWTGQSSSSNLYSTLYAQLLPYESHNFMGLILCFENGKYSTATTFDYSVKNTTSGFIRRHAHDLPSGSDLIVIVPKSIFSVSDDDHMIEFTANKDVKTVGIHLLYKTETNTIENKPCVGMSPSPLTLTETPATTACPSPSETMSSATISQPPFSSPSSSTPTRWDVFLSFRSSDTLHNFTSHLYSALDGHDIRVFRDDPELSRGEVISNSLIQAIHESKTYIVVFSKNYASSHWCLDELVEILNCHKTAERSIIPVFYKIHPSVVRRQIGSFEGAFEKHHFRFETEKVEEWRSTLRQVADLPGFHICENRHEADIINQMVDEILPKINSKVLDVAKYPVGLDSRVKVLTALLNSGTEKDFAKIGLYGMGGVGKTTLAKALFNQLLRTGSFKDSCFLENVREVSGTLKGIESLQQKFINNVLKKEIEIANVEEGITLIKERICSKKVLVLIDDIDDPRQYKSLVGSFASGSVVITTTRDQEMLDKIEVEPKFQYRVNELDAAESRELFTQHAFRNAEQNNTLMLLSTDILRHADGLPMALEVFGSCLYNQNEDGWKSYIEKLQRVPNNTIQQKLIISLDAIELEDQMLKEIFLDIACFFIRWDREEAVKIMGTYYQYADHKIEILKNKCLVNINYNAFSKKHELDMHVLLRDMGREIVRNVSPGRQSRLWVLEDVYDVLKKDKGTKAIEGIISHKLSYKCFPPKAFKTFRTKTFKRMTKLRFLYLKDVNLTGSFEQTFEDLRWFRWEGCPLKCLPSEFYPQKLGILELPYSYMRTIWEKNLVPHVFEKMKTLNMMNSKDLTTTPDFTKLPCLESLNLAGCESLEEVHISIESLERLQCLNLDGCVKLRSLPDTICNLRSLEILNVNGCGNLKALPMAIGNIESLKEIYVKQLNVSKLPDSIGRLTKLVELNLRDNKKLETLPDTICNLRSLEILNINSCRLLERLPDQLWKLTRLRKLDASWATRLRRLPDIEPSQIALSLQELKLNSNDITALPSGFTQLSNLQILDLNHCPYLLSIPKLPPSLKTIRANECSFLKRLPDLSNLKQLEELDLNGCMELTDIPSFPPNLKIICANRCSSLERLPDLSNLKQLEELKLNYCTKLTDIPSFPPNLKTICADWCSSLERLPDLSNLKQLKELKLNYCTKLTDIPSFPPNLKTICVNRCSSLERLPDLSILKQLEELKLKDCMKLMLRVVFLFSLFVILILLNNFKETIVQYLIIKLPRY